MHLVHAGANDWPKYEYVTLLNLSLEDMKAI